MINGSDPGEGQLITETQIFADWLGYLGSWNGSSLPDLGVEDEIGGGDGPPMDTTGVVAPTQPWVTVQAGKSPIVTQFTFETPLGVPPAQQCGRVTFDDYHVEDRSLNPTTGQPFPAECDTLPETPLEQTFEYTLFDTPSTYSVPNTNFGSVNVCPPGGSAPAPCSQTLTVHFALNPNKGSPPSVGNTPQVLVLQNGNNCIAVNACEEVVTFTPSAPGVRVGAVQVFDSTTGLLVATTLLYRVGEGPAAAFLSGVQTSVSANGLEPSAVALDSAGDVFIAESAGNVVELPSTGNGTYGNQITLATGLNLPTGLAVDGAGDVFIAENGDGLIVELPRGCTSSAYQVTVASGLNPYGVALDGGGDLFIADVSNQRVLEIPAGCTNTTCQITLDSGLSAPYGVAVDAAGDLFIADNGASTVFELPAGCTSSACQITVTSELSGPSSVSVDAAGDVFVADTYNNRVVEVPNLGNGNYGPEIIVGSGLAGPGGVALDAAGDVFIADTQHSRVVVVERSEPPAFSFAPTPIGAISSDSPQSAILQNIGNQPLNAVSPGLSVGANFAQVAGSGTPALQHRLRADPGSDLQPEHQLRTANGGPDQ
jgi:streptogramin lyase